MKIFLIGLPGCGKSTLGKQLAENLNIPFVDLDSEIEKSIGIPIKNIFKKYGESFFRKEESEQLHRFGDGPDDFVMAAGGGVAVFFVNRKLVQMFSADFAVMLPQVNAGKLKPLAVTTAKRSPLLPGVPAMAEAIKGFEVDTWRGLVAPAGTPADVIAKLNKADNAAASSNEVQEKFAGIGFAVEPGTPEDLAKRGASETAKWAKAIKDAKIEPQ